MCIFLGHFASLLCHGPTINGGLSSASLILNFCFVLGCKAEIFLQRGTEPASPGIRTFFLDQWRRRGQPHSSLTLPHVSAALISPEAVTGKDPPPAGHPGASFTPNSVSSPHCTSNLWGESTVAFLDRAPASACWEFRVKLRCHTCVRTRVSHMREAQKGKFHFSFPHHPPLALA